MAERSAAVSETALAGIGMTSRRTRLRLQAQLQVAGIDHPRVLELMRDMPRHLFVDTALASRAYDDVALPIGYGQTISRPSVVARMSQALLADGVPARVLEIGTGCGYQTAILSQLAAEVCSIERIEPLYRQARDRLVRMRFAGIRLHHGDGALGWPQALTFDAILLTAAPAEVPPALLAQLAPGGRLIAPVHEGGDAQRLRKLVRTSQGYECHDLGEVNFVPLLEGTQ